MIINYDSRVVPDLIIPSYYNSIVEIYDRKAFKRLTQD